LMALSAVLVPSAGATGETGAPIVQQCHQPIPVDSTHFFSVGLAAANGLVYLDRAADATIYAIHGSDCTPAPVSNFNTQTGGASGSDPIIEMPEALTYDPVRGGLWIGTQNGDGVNGGVGVFNQHGACSCMPIYFWNFTTNVVKQEF